MSAVVKSRAWDVCFSDGYRLTVVAATVARAATAAAVLRRGESDHPLIRAPLGFVVSVRYLGDSLTRDISEDIAVQDDLR